MPSEEGKQVLHLLAEGKIDAEQAYRLLRALGDIEGRTGAKAPPPPPPPPGAPEPPLAPGMRSRILRIQVLSHGKNKVNIAVPLGIARLGRTKMATSGLVRGHLAKFGIDLDEVLRSIDHPGEIVDISDNEDRVLITVE